ncbi:MULTISPECIES: DUF982 domain-containing protein [Rhizobium]|uniref:DUF982 domain-containing protein n=1 Tax=Rhizobium phaseoli TaxID=396 RepID=A0A192T7Q6_9HYPH|nr:MULTISPECIES: DUF982 domain-containing protein [Rhizobium]ANL39752.1 hypothetical protein AMC88_CH01326 [Rhizobium phaseoli]ANL45994.1 hypothetical protein AMC87_CH01274 [Rhizobium phaseoli]ANL52455.1 hypothetical protein AMC86_CH01278 [Rhizobium phaseoli]ANL58741.1 hypothetical protein AMC85_CH01326 [Rhizobium phaseoli]ANL65003.1 hypothetical protein AMC84_CH01317 [Rhizobium phaseoli]
MRPDVFKQPVTIFVGLGFPAEVRTVMEAYRHLDEWPAMLRDAAHSVALKACAAALRGEIEAETARGLFLAFAEKHDLLAPEKTAVTSARVAQRGSARASSADLES